MIKTNCGVKIVGLSMEQDRQIEIFYRELSAKLFIYAVNSLDNESLAEEAVQETFRIACTKPEEFLGSSNPKGWLVKTLKNVINNIRRSQARLNRMLMSAIPLEDVIVEATDKSEYIDIMYSDLIKKEEYELLKKIVVNQYSIFDIAQELGISVEACKKRVQRAKMKLKRILEDT